MTSLTFGIDTVFDFTADDEIPDGGYVVQASATGTEWGNPEAVVTSIRSQLLDGSLGKITSFGNRTATVMLRIVASDSDALAQGEADLMAEVYRDGWNALTWTPPSASVATVFDVVYADLQVAFDDQAELIAERTYSLTLTCLPRPRSASLVSVASLPVQSSTPATTTINDGSSSANWTTTGQVETRRNLILNPSFETGVADWAPGANSNSLGWQTDWAASGQRSGSVIARAANDKAYLNPTAMPATAGLAYSFRAQLRAVTDSTGITTGVLFRYFNASGSIVAEYDHAGPAAPPNTPVTVTATDTAPAGTASVVTYPYVYIPAGFAGVPVSVTLEIDGVLLEQASTPGAYFDGDSPNSGWVGARGDSASVALAAATMTSIGGMISAGKTFGTSASYTLSQTINASTQTYVAVAGNVTFQEGGTASGVTFTLASGGVTYTPARTPSVDASGNFTAYFRVAASLTSATFTASGAGLAGGFTTLKIDSVFTSDSLPPIGTNRQQARSLTVYGSARTQASLRVETTDASLGAQTLVYTGAPKSSGFQPALRSYRTAGPAVTTDASQCSGSTNALATTQASADTWTIDATLLDPSTYGLYARLIVASTTTVTLNWSATGTTSGVTVTGSRAVTIGTGGQFISIGSLDLPTARVYAGSTDNVVIQLWASASGVTIDDAYLFDSLGRLSIIGTSNASLLLLNSASIDEPQATVWTGKAIGSSGGSSTADTKVVYAGNQATAWDQHEFKPPTESVFVVTPGTLLARVSMTYYPRWGHHAAPVAA